MLALQEPSKLLKADPQHLRYAARMANSNRLDSYMLEKEAFDQALKTLPKKQAEQIREALEALRFIDFEDVASQLINIYLSDSSKSFADYNLQYLYNQNRSANDPEFKNIQKLNNWLKEHKENISISKIISAQKIAMQNCADIPKEEIGIIRSYAVIGDETENGINKKQLTSINKNPYLSFLLNKETKEGNYIGEIEYPSIDNIKHEALELISDSNPRICLAVKQYLSLNDSQKEEIPEDKKTSLNKSLIKALTQERIDSYNYETRILGDLTTEKDVLKFIKCTASFYRDMIAIHPLGDGNGRVLRQVCLYDPLNKKGIARPRLNNPNGDILYSESQFYKEVLRGIRNTSITYWDITERINQSMPLKQCPLLLYPNMPPDVMLHKKTYGRALVENNFKFIPIDPKQFATFLEIKLLNTPKLYDQMQVKPLEVLKLVHEEYKNFVKSTQVIYQNMKQETEVIRTEFIDPDFISCFGVNCAENKSEWQYKMNNWYLPKLISRGLPDTEYSPSDEELISYFSNFNALTVSQNILENWDDNASQNDLREQILNEFQRYNKDLFLMNLARQAHDHADEGPLYDTSYGLSTSRRWVIAKAFAMGALSLDGDIEGGSFKQYKKMQHLLQSRILITSYQSRKDLVLPRLRQVSSDFKYKYFRQQEVMAIGGIDPDSIMYVQRVDPKGKIESTFYRDPKNPSNIIKLSGHIVPRI